eukprot:m.115146 g.115146  ORF g.115146 m.115146 type:complete len:244 (-) comp16328_c0_seq5:681-1412(-)
MRLIDCHAHLTDPELAADLDELLTGAAGQGVVRIVAVAEDVGDVTPLLALRDKAADKASLRWPAIDVCIGIHPCKAVSAVRRAGTVPALLESLRDLVVANRSSIVGIGECGLDYTPKVLAQGHGAEQVKEMQLAVLAGQARLSAEFDLPLNVHSRSAGHHAIDFLRQHQVSRAVFHAFDGRGRTRTYQGRLNKQPSPGPHGFVFPPPPGGAPCFSLCTQSGVWKLGLCFRFHLLSCGRRRRSK